MLRDLDARLVPRLAGWLRTSLDRAQDRRLRARRALTDRWRRVLDPSGRGPLRRLDDRYAASWPLRLLRDVPQLGVLLVATVFLAGVGVALVRSGPDSGRERQPAEQEVALPMTLGPAVGADVEQHLAEDAARAVELARESPSTRYLALVSLRRELTVEQTAGLTLESALEVRKAYVRAPVQGAPETFEVEPGEDVARTLTALFTETARRKADEQREFLALAQSIEPTGEQEKAFRAEYERAARTSGLEATVYRTGCTCVVAVVVEGDAAQLAELLSLRRVRGVEVAPLGAQLSALEVRPLLPDVTGTVPEPVVRQ